MDALASMDAAATSAAALGALVEQVRVLRDLRLVAQALGELLDDGVAASGEQARLDVLALGGELRRVRHLAILQLQEIEAAVRLDHLIGERLLLRERERDL